MIYDDVNIVKITPLINLGVVKSNPVDKTEESIVATLTTQNSKLKHQHGVIIEKNKQLVELLEKKKREITAIKRTNLVKGKSTLSGQASKENFLPQDVEIRAAATHFADRNVNSSMIIESKSIPQTINAAADSNLIEIARKYKARYLTLLCCTITSHMLHLPKLCSRTLFKMQHFVVVRL